METPYVISEIINQMGGRGLKGAFCFIGAKDLGFTAENEGRPNRESAVTPQGLIDYGVGLSFGVNGKPSRNWKMVVSYEPNDTYTVRLFQTASKKQRENGIFGEVLDERNNVYCDELQKSVERMYDHAINKYCGGFIPLS